MFQCNFQFLTIQNDIRKCTKTLKEIHDIKYLYLSSVCMHERIVSWSIFENIFPLIPFNLGADILLLIAGHMSSVVVNLVSSAGLGRYARSLFHLNYRSINDNTDRQTLHWQTVVIILTWKIVQNQINVSS